jgi:hypothetical protein
VTIVQSCGGCGFWARHGEHDGACRRHAPRPAERADAVAHWPMTRATEGCGEGAPRGPRTPALPHCDQCRYWRGNPGGGLTPQNRRDERQDWWASAGRCVRHAPGPSSDPGSRGFWRATHRSDSCAEGEPND